MAISYRREVGEMIDLLQDGLRQPVVDLYEQVYQAQFLDEIDAVLSSGRYRLSEATRQEKSALLQSLDTYRVLKLIQKRWHIWQNLLPGPEDVEQAMTLRNQWAHQEPLTADQVLEAAQSCIALLFAVGSTEQANLVEALYQAIEQKELEQRAPTTPILFGQCTRQSSGSRRISSASSANSMANVVWPSRAAPVPGRRSSRPRKRSG
ncbi:MAG: hypothetical protein IPK19_41450 [Chloroflexi bacterium]|nr:hypothetical protein [Chloroflexota bacterium]